MASHRDRKRSYYDPRFYIFYEVGSFSVHTHRKIFPGTDLEKFALNHGVPRSVINESIDKSYHQVTPTLPFSKDFTEKYKLKFLKNYVLNKKD